MLQRAGFVHVTGLETSDSAVGRGYRIGESLRFDQVGHWDYNNGLTVVVTPGGELWLTSGQIGAGMYDLGLEETSEGRILRELCPNGRGAFVPCSNGEHVSMHDLLLRVRDPYARISS